ncbi:hypothetical protein [Actinomadura sp. 3N508]
MTRAHASSGFPPRSRYSGTGSDAESESERRFALALALDCILDGLAARRR